MRHLFKEPTIPREVAKYEPPVDLDSLLDGLTLAKLQKIFDSVMKRKEDKIDPVRSSFGTIKKEPVSLEQKNWFCHDVCKSAQDVQLPADFGKTDRPPGGCGNLSGGA